MNPAAASIVEEHPREGGNCQWKADLPEVSTNSSADHAGKLWRSKGAQTQRVLWASTSTKNPNYRDVLYVEELIGKDTVNTIPPATFDAFRDHGKLRESLTENIEASHGTRWRRSRKVGISMKEVTDKLTKDGVEAVCGRV